MYKAFSVIELLILFLLINIIVAGFMHMTLIQMQDNRMQNTRLEEAERQANEIIEDIEDIREQNEDYEEEILEDR